MDTKSQLAWQVGVVYRRYIEHKKKKGGGGVLGISFIEAIQNILLGNSMGFVTLSIITWVEKQRSKAKWRIEPCILMVEFMFMGKVTIREKDSSVT